MTGTISAADVGRPAAETQCRVSERFTCDVAVSCQPPSAWRGGGREWPARVRNVSADGLCLVLRRRFEPGTGLAIEVPGAEGESPSTLLARVVRVRAGADGCWMLGCAFVSPLGEEEILGLLRRPAGGRRAGRPAVRDQRRLPRDAARRRRGPAAHPQTLRPRIFLAAAGRLRDRPSFSALFGGTGGASARGRLPRRGRPPGPSVYLLGRGSRRPDAACRRATGRGGMSFLI